MLRKLRFALPLLLLSGCAWHPLDVQTQYLSHENLASYYVGTPDPCLNKPKIGQRLLVQWSLPRAWMNQGPLLLHLSLLFRNRGEKKISVPIERSKGFYVYELLGEEYAQTGGILTYYAEIRGNGCPLTHWKHPLWTPLIRFDLPD